jgi:dynein heavy chain
VLNCAGIIKRESTKQKEKDAAQKELQKEMTMKEIEQEEI